jgi:hypothetical protein
VKDLSQVIYRMLIVKSIHKIEINQIFLNNMSISFDLNHHSIQTIICQLLLMPSIAILARTIVTKIDKEVVQTFARLLCQSIHNNYTYISIGLSTDNPLILLWRSPIVAYKNEEIDSIALRSSARRN